MSVIYIIQAMKTSMFPNPKSASAIVGQIQCMRYATVQPYLSRVNTSNTYGSIEPYMKRPIVMQGPPTMAKGRRFSGASRDVAKEGAGSSLCTASRTCGKYHFLLNKTMTIVAAMTPTPTPRKVKPVDRLSNS